MMKVTSKYKICKRLGAGVFEKCQTQKYTVSEARSQKLRRDRRGRGMSDYGKQLIEKQKVRYTYGIQERQLERYAVEAFQKSSEPMKTLFQSLERRLDSVVFRMGLAHTRRLARQIVSHGHITVNGKKISVPSHKLVPGDSISIREGSKGKVLFSDLAERIEQNSVAQWVRFNVKKQSGKLERLPELSDVPLSFDLRAVFEYYSR